MLFPIPTLCAHTHERQDCTRTHAHRHTTQNPASARARAQPRTSACAEAAAGGAESQLQLHAAATARADPRGRPTAPLRSVGLPPLFPVADQQIARTRARTRTHPDATAQVCRALVLEDWRARLEHLSDKVTDARRCRAAVRGREPMQHAACNIISVQHCVCCVVSVHCHCRRAADCATAPVHSAWHDEPHRRLLVRRRLPPPPPPPPPPESAWRWRSR